MSAAIAKVPTKETVKAAAPAPPQLSASASGQRDTLARSPNHDALPKLSAQRMSALLPQRLQPSMQVSSPGDAAEREAEATAKKVARMPQPRTAPLTGGLSQPLAVARKPQRAQLSALLPASAGPQRAPLSPPGPVIQLKADGAPTVAPDVAHDIRGSMGSGTPLPPSVRGFMEPRFRANFGRVRVHTGDKPAGLARRLSAKAFTVGGNIFFGKGQFRPGSQDGNELIAHELTHTIQQGASLQRSEETVQRSEDLSISETAPVQVQRFGIPNPLDFFADKANMIPGFRMFTIILGVNPINMSGVDPSAANILRALIEFLPGGGLITQALENSGVFDKVGNWVAQQIKTLGMVGSAIKQAVTDFIKSLGPSDAFNLGGVWERAKRIFTEPIDRIISFAKGLVNGIIQFVKDAILIPLAKLAEGTAGYALLKAVLGKDPISGEKAPDDASALLGALMTLAGQEEIWGNIQKANALSRITAWFKGAKAGLLAFVQQIPALAIAAFKSLELADIVLVPRALVKVAAVFGGFLGQFIGWVGTAVWNLLEIVFDVVSPGAFGYVKKTGAALKSILKNPLPFVGNLVKAAKLGFTNFAGNFLGHLKKGLLDWLTGSLPGVYIPTALSLPEFGKLALSVFGITWEKIRGMIVEALGPSGETIMKGLETTLDVVKALVTGGPAAAWEVIKQKLTDLKDMIVDGIIGFIKDTVVQKAIPKLIAMFIPGAGFISAILSIYDTVMVFVQKISKIIQIVTAFINSIVAIAAGNIGAAATKVESILAGLLSLAISFLAGFAGLGKVADKLMGVINKVRDKVYQALKTAVNWIVGQAKRLGKFLVSKLTGEDKRTPEDKQRDLNKAVAELAPKVANMFERGIPRPLAMVRLAVWKRQYKLTSLTAEGGKVVAAINPTADMYSFEEVEIGKLLEPILVAAEQQYLAGSTGSAASQASLATARKDVAAGTPVSIPLKPDENIQLLRELTSGQLQVPALGTNRAGNRSTDLTTEAVQGTRVQMRDRGSAAAGEFQSGQGLFVTKAGSYYPAKTEFTQGADTTASAMSVNKQMGNAAASGAAASPALQQQVRDDRYLRDVVEPGRIPGIMASNRVGQGMVKAGLATEEQITTGKMAGAATFNSAAAAMRDAGGGTPVGGRHRKPIAADKLDDATAVRQGSFAVVFLELRNGINQASGKTLKGVGKPLKDLAKAFDAWLKGAMPAKDNKTKSDKEIKRLAAALKSKLVSFLKSQQQ